ncbi:PAS domain S-box protein [Candidatus Bathyarchaeota archaeon]|nr:PAS domain S-box protein [Candidatus Bathyarchaeota archaeon]
MDTFLIDALDEGIILFNTQGKILHVNPAIKALSGEGFFLKDGVQLPEACESILSEDQYMDVMVQLENLVDQDVISEFAIANKRSPVPPRSIPRNGFIININPIPSKPDLFLLHLKQGRSTNPTKSIPAMVDTYPSFTKNIMEALPLILNIHDPETRDIIYSNGKIKEVLGYSLEEFRKMGNALIERLIHPRDAEKVATYHANLPFLEEGDAKTLEYRMKDVSGSWHWLKCWDTLLANEAGEFSSKILSLALDITPTKISNQLVEEQWRLRKKLETEDKFEKLLEACGFAILEISNCDALGIYLVDDETGNLELIYHEGLSPEFIRETRCYSRDSPSAELVYQGTAIYKTHGEIRKKMDDVRKQEGLKALGILPLKIKNKIIGCVNIASHDLERIDDRLQKSIETIASQVAFTIMKWKDERELEDYKKHLEAIVEEKNFQLRERMKELQCLYDMTNLGEESKSTVTLLENAVNVIPQSFQYPDYCHARIMYGDVAYSTPGFKQTPWMLSESTDLHGRTLEIVVIYDVERKFLEEEEKLIKIILQKLKQVLERNVNRIKVQESESRFRFIFHNAPVALLEEDFSEVRASIDRFKRDGIQDIKGYLKENLKVVRELASQVKITAANNESINLFHAGDESALIGSLEHLLPSSSLVEFEKELHLILDHQQLLEVETTRKTLTGRLKNVIVRMMNPGENKRFEKILVGIIDVSALKRAELKIESQYKKFLAILESYPEVIYVCDPETHELLFVSNKLKEFLGKDPTGEVCYKALQDLDEPCDFCTNDILFKKKKPYVWEYHNPLIERDFLITDKVIKWPDGRDVRFEVAIDITKRKEAEKHLEVILKKLRRSNRELEQFAYIASHDLQEPLRMVSSYLQLIERRYGEKLDATAHEFIDFAVDGAKRMKTLINDLLLFSRVQTRGKAFLETDLNEVIDEARKNLQFMIQETGAVIQNDELPTIKVDKTQFIQLFQNLLNNAIKFHRDEVPFVKVSCRKDEDAWIFSFKDNGIGIKKEYFKKIFLIFQRLHAKGLYPGTGIGLAICKHIVARHGGKIWLESEPGAGSTFHVAIPHDVEEFDKRSDLYQIEGS